MIENNRLDPVLITLVIKTFYKNLRHSTKKLNRLSTYLSDRVHLPHPLTSESRSFSIIYPEYSFPFLFSSQFLPTFSPIQIHPFPSLITEQTSKSV